jgi:protein-tyrosine-phosphatase
MLEYSTFGSVNLEIEVLFVCVQNAGRSQIAEGSSESMPPTIMKH